MAERARLAVAALGEPHAPATHPDTGGVWYD
jgi:hypothetical protein